MEKIKTIGLVAHDNRKQDLVEWVKWNRKSLHNHRLVCTGTTGKLVEAALMKLDSDEHQELKFSVTKLKSGPLGGDQQMGAMICEGKIDIVIFLWDPMQAQPHDVDVKALLRLAALYNIPIAQNRATADFIISSPLFNQDYQRIIRDYGSYINRDLQK